MNDQENHSNDGAVSLSDFPMLEHLDKVFNGIEEIQALNKNESVDVILIAHRLKPSPNRPKFQYIGATKLLRVASQFKNRAELEAEWFDRGRAELKALYPYSSAKATNAQKDEFKLHQQEAMANVGIRASVLMQKYVADAGATCGYEIVLKGSNSSIFLLRIVECVPQYIVGSERIPLANVLKELLNLLSGGNSKTLDDIKSDAYLSRDNEAIGPGQGLAATMDIIIDACQNGEGIERHELRLEDVWPMDRLPPVQTPAPDRILKQKPSRTPDPASASAGNGNDETKAGGAGTRSPTTPAIKAGESSSVASTSTAQEHHNVSLPPPPAPAVPSPPPPVPVALESATARPERMLPAPPTGLLPGGEVHVWLRDRADSAEGMRATGRLFGTLCREMAAIKDPEERRKAEQWRKALALAIAERLAPVRGASAEGVILAQAALNAAEAEAAKAEGLLVEERPIYRVLTASAGAAARQRLADALDYEALRDLLKTALDSGARRDDRNLRASLDRVLEETAGRVARRIDLERAYADSSRAGSEYAEHRRTLETLADGIARMDADEREPYLWRLFGCLREAIAYADLATRDATNATGGAKEFQDWAVTFLERTFDAVAKAEAERSGGGQRTDAAGLMRVAYGALAGGAHPDRFFRAFARFAVKQKRPLALAASLAALMPEAQEKAFGKVLAGEITEQALK